MPDIIQRLKDAYSENPAKALELLPELFNEVDEGKIIELPCKAGDECYILIPSYSTGSQLLGILPAPVKIAEMVVWRIEILRGSIWITDSNKYSGKLGKNVFLTREAAEKALEEQKNETNL
jgi:hypothetical protein